jgi:hypothetical protein
MRKLVFAAAVLLIGAFAFVSSTPDTLADDCAVSKSETVDAVKPAPFDLSGQHCSVPAHLLEKSKRTHFDGNAKPTYCPKDGKITKVKITLEGAISTPSWTDEAKTPDKQKKFIKEYFAVLKAHEERHAAIFRKVFKNVHAKLIGKTRDQATEILKKLECEEAKEHYALDKKEGYVHVTTKSDDSCVLRIEGREHPEYLTVCD